MPPRIIAVASQKGGVGKTTTAVNLAAELARLGYLTLLIDLDPQAHATTHLGIAPEGLQWTVYDVLHNPDKGPGFAIIDGGEGRLDVLPANIELAGADIDLVSKIGRESLLRNALSQLVSLIGYAFIIIDTPPNLGLLTLNALGVATEVLVPVTTEFLPMKGLALIQNTITMMRGINPAVRLGGIVCTQVDCRRNLDKAVIAELRASFPALVYQAQIPIDVKLAEAPAAGQPIYTYAPKSQGALAYTALTEELINGEV